MRYQPFLQAIWVSDAAQMPEFRDRSLTGLSLDLEIKQNLPALDRLSAYVRQMLMLWYRWTGREGGIDLVDLPNTDQAPDGFVASGHATGRHLRAAIYYALTGLDIYGT